MLSVFGKNSSNPLDTEQVWIVDMGKNKWLMMLGVLHLEFTLLIAVEGPNEYDEEYCRGTGLAAHSLTNRPASSVVSFVQNLNIVGS